MLQECSEIKDRLIVLRKKNLPMKETKMADFGAKI